MENGRGRVTAALVNVSLIAAAAWFFFATGRRAWNRIAEGRFGEALEGTSLPLTVGADWPLERLVFKDRERTVVLGLSADCRVCQESRPFYRQLIAMSAAPSARFGVSILLNKSAGKEEFVKSLGRGHSRAHEVRLKEFGIHRTPTAWVIARGGGVLFVQVGRLSKAREGNLVGLANGRFPSLEVASAYEDELPFELTEAAFRQLTANGVTQLLDVRAREASALQRGPFRAVNIPLDELPARAPEELDPKVRTVVDCTHLDPRVCDAAAFGMGREGFFRVHVLNRGSTPASSCEAQGGNLHR